MRCGFHAGIQDELLSAGADNPRGFWERRDVVALNDKLLAASESSWFQPMPVAKQDVAEIRQLVEGLSFRSPWLLKDPRLVFTWPAWAPVLRTTAKLFVYRSPMAVAASLNERHGFPLEYGLDLWEIYNRQAIKIMQAEGGALINYEAFSHQPKSAWEELHKRLGAIGVSIGVHDGGFDYDQQLDHSRAVPVDESRLTLQQRRLHKVLLEACESNQLPKRLPAQSSNLAQRVQGFGQAFTGLSEVAELRAAVEVLTSERDLARDRFNNVQNEYEALTVAYNKDRSDLQSLAEERKRREELEQQNAALEANRHSASEELAQLREVLKQKAAVEQHNTVLEVARSKDREELSALREELKQKAEQHNAILEECLRKERDELASLRNELKRQIAVERQNAVLEAARLIDSEELSTLRTALQRMEAVEQKNEDLEAACLKDSQELTAQREELQYKAAVEQRNVVLEAARIKDRQQLLALREELERKGAVQKHNAVLEAGRRIDSNEIFSLQNALASTRDTVASLSHELERKEADLVIAGHELAASLKAQEAAAQELILRERIMARNLETERQLEAKADYLFGELNSVYLKLLAYRKKPVARLTSAVVMLYKLVTLRPRSETDFESILKDANRHVREYTSPSLLAGRSRTRLGFIVISYLIRNPVASIRSASWPRFKRALSVFFGTSREDLEVWVQQRFHAIDGFVMPEVKPELEPPLDDLELSFPRSVEPRVSIVIPVYNEYRMTIFCLRSLLSNTIGVDYEVILADDASTDLTSTIVERIKGIEIVRGKENQGFVNNCRNAACFARGEYLLFLNNDTAFTEDWLHNLVAVLDADPSAGIVGPMLLFGNGRLQEAGGIIWDDASGWNFGRMDDPSRPEYNYLKETDYISGACLLIRRSLWDEVGGFDQRYVPAYYEDTDLCFAVRAAGYKVLYQPSSRIYHFEGISNGTDLGSGIKKHQLVNKEKFFEKWAATLERENFPNAQRVFLAKDRSRNRRTVLVIDHYVPSYDKDAGSRSTWLYLQLMVDLGYNVKFVGANFFPHQPYTQELQAMGVEVLVGEKMARNFPTWLQENAANIDAIYVHRPHIAEQFLSFLNNMNPRPKMLYFGHDLHFMRVEREHEVTGDKKYKDLSEEWKKRELAVFENFDKVYFPSQVEVEMVAEVAPDVDVSAIPLYVMEESEIDPYIWKDRADILFVAGFNHSPNIDAVCWFVEEILPLVVAACPDITLNVVGSNTPDAVKALASKHVVIHGYLTDEELAEQYRQAKMVAVPLRFGAGVKGKILEALQHGVPLVTTAIGAEGLPEPTVVFNIKETAAEFAQELIEIEHGCRQRLQKLNHYSKYLDQYFSKSRAKAILFRDFGEPRIDRDGL